MMYRCGMYVDGAYSRLCRTLHTPHQALIHSVSFAWKLWGGGGGGENPMECFKVNAGGTKLYGME